MASSRVNPSLTLPLSEPISGSPMIPFYEPLGDLTLRLCVLKLYGAIVIIFLILSMIIFSGEKGWLCLIIFQNSKFCNYATKKKKQASTSQALGILGVLTTPGRGRGVKGKYLSCPQFLYRGPCLDPLSCRLKSKATVSVFHEQEAILMCQHLEFQYW